MSTQQFQLDFSQRLPVSAQIGMKQADDNASEMWKHWFDAAIMVVALKQPELTSDDILAELARMPGVPSTHNLSAIGPAMKRSWEAGVIEHTDRVKRSEIRHKRGNLHTVWLSKVFCSSNQRKENAG